MPQANGEVPSGPAVQSAFIKHLLDYPIIHDGVTTFQKNQFGHRSIEIGDQAYKIFAQPIIPYLRQPLSYVTPYVEKADSFGDNTLKKVDERFPIVKKPTDELYSEAKHLVLLPYHKGLEGKDYAFKTYSEEVKKFGGENVVTYSKALVSTVFTLSADTLNYVGAFLNAKKAEAKEHVNDVKN